MSEPMTVVEMARFVFEQSHDETWESTEDITRKIYLNDMREALIYLRDNVTEEMVEACFDATDGCHHIDGDKGPWLDSEGYELAFKAAINAALNEEVG